MGREQMNVRSLPLDPTLAGDGQKRLMRNASSLSTESSEFEFDSPSFAEIYDEGPVSPKLLNFSNNWDHSPTKSLMISSTSMAYAELSEAIVISDHHSFNALPSSPALAADYSKPSHGREGIKPDNQDQNVRNSAGGNIQAGPDQIHTNHQKDRMSLASLLNKRDFTQLPPLTAHIKLGFESKKQMRDCQSLQGSPWQPWTPSTSSSDSSSTVSPSSTPAEPKIGPCSYGINDDIDHSHHFNDPKSGADVNPYINYQKKPCRKWGVIKLDFLRKTVPRSRADHRGEEKLRIFSNHESDQPLDNYATEVCPRVSFESARGSTCSLINYANGAASPVHHSSLYANGRRSMSAATSPAHDGTSPRSPSPVDATGRRGTRGRKAPMRSPHARHYFEEQRARTEELRRRTPLPYRHSLFGACFFPPSHDQFHTRAHIVAAGQQV